MKIIGSFKELEWPPSMDSQYMNPIDEDEEDAPHTGFLLPETPWTYGSEAFNPALQASNTQIRSRHVYEADSDEEEYESEFTHLELPRVRRGSEGLEVRPVNREEMLRLHIEGLAQQEGRYNRYVPEEDLDSEDSLDDSGSGVLIDDNEGEEMPLAKVVETWRAGTVEGGPSSP
jgi:palmitoyltransferase ZDHHC6